MLLPREGHDERRESSTPQLPRPITVMIASDRQALLLAKMARLMHEPGIELHAESLTDPARLGYSIEQKSPAVLLLDKAMLDRLDGESIQTIRALANAIADLLSASPCIVAAKPIHSARSSTTLTHREQQIVDLLRCGCTNKEIANQLGVMEDTVKKHLQSVFRKLGVRRRALVALRPHPAASSCN